MPIVAMETLGSNCFYSSMALNSNWKGGKGIPEDTDVTFDEDHNVKVANLKQISSRASSLGACSPAPGVVGMALRRKGEVKCVCVPDAMSMGASVSFAGA